LLADGPFDAVLVDLSLSGLHPFLSKPLRRGELAELLRVWLGASRTGRHLARPGR